VVGVLEDGTWDVLSHHWKNYWLENDVSLGAQNKANFFIIK
jgi:hypothetical protein